MPKEQKSEVTKIYDDYIAEINQQKSGRYSGMEEWYHSSSAGLCIRKHWFSSKEKIKGAPRDENTLRLFRLGDMIHSDIQDAVRVYSERTGAPIFIEKELFIEEWGVRGFIDLVLINDGVLYDIKSCNSWKWKTMFGKKYYDENSSSNYNLQTATYGYWYKKEFDENLKAMKLLYYNKDNSQMREVDVPMESIKEAERYWLSVVESVKNSDSIPPLSVGTSPAYSWECNEKYCIYYDACGGGIKENLKKGD